MKSASLLLKMWINLHTTLIHMISLHGCDSTWEIVALLGHVSKDLMILEPHINCKNKIVKTGKTSFDCHKWLSIIKGGKYLTLLTSNSTQKEAPKPLPIWQSPRPSLAFHSVALETCTVFFTSNITKKDLCKTLIFASWFYIDVLFLILLSTLQEFRNSKKICHPTFKSNFQRWLKSNYQCITVI